MVQSLSICIEFVGFAPAWAVGWLVWKRGERVNPAWIVKDRAQGEETFSSCPTLRPRRITLAF